MEIALVTKEFVVVVHGTFAAEAKWWRRGSAFCAALDRELQARGLAARCWGGPACTVPEFSWSGANSELARERAARELVRYAEDLATSHGIRKIHFVCHSHGGNVFMQIGGNLEVETILPLLNGTKIFLGTPFFDYARPRTDEYTSVLGEARLVVGLLLLAISHAVGWHGWLWYLLAALCGLQLAWFMVLPWFMAPAPRAPWRPIIFESRNAIFSFAADEALGALQAALAFGKNPRVAHFEGDRARWAGIMAARNPGLYTSLFRYFGRYSPLRDRPSTNGLASFLHAEIDAIRSLWDSLWLPFGPSEFLVAFAVLLLPVLAWPLLYPLILVRGILVMAIDLGPLSAISRMTPFFRRLAVRRGLRAAADSALGADRLGRAVKAVRRTPSPASIRSSSVLDPMLRRRDPIWNPVEIPREEQEAATAVALRHMTELVGRFYREMGKQDRPLDLSFVDMEAIFSSMRYVHNQYYESDWIIATIADAMRPQREDDDIDAYLRDF